MTERVAHLVVVAVPTALERSVEFSKRSTVLTPLLPGTIGVIFAYADALAVLDLHVDLQDVVRSLEVSKAVLCFLCLDRYRVLEEVEHAVEVVFLIFC